MKAWAVVENGKPLREIDLPMPDPQGTEIVLDVTHCGVCHTDLHIWEGHYDLGGGRTMSIQDRGVTLPLALGHEVAGRVVARGPLATSVELGGSYIVYPWIGCGQCDACLAEEDNMCTQGKALGIIQHGGHATHVKVAHPRYLVSPKTIPLPIAATLACSGITAYSAIRKLLPLPPEEPIVIIGAGGLGLMAISILKALRHHNIVAVDLDTPKLDAAKKAGALHVIRVLPDIDMPSALSQLCGKSPRAIIDFVNGTRTARFAFDALGKGGKLVQVGLMGGELALPLPLMAMKALNVQGSYVGNLHELRELVDLVASDGFIPTPVEELPMSSANLALDRLRNGAVTGRLVLCGCRL